MSRFFLFWGAVSAFITVALGAFAAHALKARLSESALAVFDTANEYQAMHSLALIFVALLARCDQTSGLLKSSGIAFLAGILVFSGSLYLLALTGRSLLGAITPLGGLGFLAGWALLATYAVKHRTSLSA